MHKHRISLNRQLKCNKYVNSIWNDLDYPVADILTEIRLVLVDIWVYCTNLFDLDIMKQVNI